MDTGFFMRTLARRMAFVIAAAAVCLAIGSAAAPAAHAGATFAVVDVDKVFDASKEKAARDQDLQAFAKSIQAAYQQQQQSLMLSREQQKTLGELLLKQSPTDTDKATIKTLTDSSKSDLDQLTNLQQKKEKSQTLTDQDQLDLQRLTAQARAGQQTLSDINQSYQQTWEQRNTDVREAISAKIKEAVASVAQKQGIQVVLTSQVAIFAATDITKDVIAVINK
ncbi:MAG: OmpH family outer membrane protein [Capsulimonadaceae bacterium]|nr:OmpH family outer membrane protein [Capsulimonadaceae bacterium]